MHTHVTQLVWFVVLLKVRVVLFTIILILTSSPYVVLNQQLILWSNVSHAQNIRENLIWLYNYIPTSFSHLQIIVFNNQNILNFCGLIYKKYGKIWSILLDNFINHKLLISEEWWYKSLISKKKKLRWLVCDIVTWTWLEKCMFDSNSGSCNWVDVIVTIALAGCRLSQQD